MIAQYAIGATLRAAIWPDTHTPFANADLGRSNVIQFRGLFVQLEGCQARSSNVVFVGDRCAKGNVDIAALVADGQLQQGSVKAGGGTLHPAHVGVKLLARVVVRIVIDSSEAEEQGHGRTQFGLESVLPAFDAFVSARQNPFPHNLFRQGALG